MRHSALFLGTILAALSFPPSYSANSETTPSKEQSQDSITTGHLHLPGKNISYRAITGSLLVQGRDYDDSSTIMAQRDSATISSDEKKENSQTPPCASIFYTAYFRDDIPHEKRPLIFLYNGGPGSSSAWLHIGSFGPYRLNTPGNDHLPAAPYTLVPNPQTLLDVADLVFIDAPGTGFSRITGERAEKEFYGLDGDASAFTHFIMQFLAKYDHFNTPKYLFGESYGTLRSALVASKLTQEEGIELNGIILLSQILSYENSVDGADANPGADLPYVLALPSYAAAAWYHHALPAQPAALEPFLHEVEHFATTDYLLALQQGSDLPIKQRQSIAEKLHLYTGLSTDYLLRAQLRVTGSMFEQTLLQEKGLTIGRLDSRHSGPSIDPMARDATYDPQISALSSAYISSINHYLRNTLHYGGTDAYRDLVMFINAQWDGHHIASNGQKNTNIPNVMPDLATVMKTNPNLKLMLNSGFYDLATPYYEGIYEMKHLPIPDVLQKNISYYHYPAGHMVYIDPAALQDLHDNIVHFVQTTSTP